MRPASDWDEDYLNQLIAIGEQESLTLDYKRSAALTKDDKEKNDMSKDGGLSRCPRVLDPALWASMGQ